MKYSNLIIVLIITCVITLQVASASSLPGCEWVCTNLQRKHPYRCVIDCIDNKIDPEVYPGKRIEQYLNEQISKTTKFKIPEEFDQKCFGSAMKFDDEYVAALYAQCIISRVQMKTSYDALPLGKIKIEEYYESEHHTQDPINEVTEEVKNECYDNCLPEGPGKKMKGKNQFDCYASCVGQKSPLTKDGFCYDRCDKNYGSQYIIPCYYECASNRKFYSWIFDNSNDLKLGEVQKEIKDSCYNYCLFASNDLNFSPYKCYDRCLFDGNVENMLKKIKEEEEEKAKQKEKEEEKEEQQKDEDGEDSSTDDDGYLTIYKKKLRN